MKIPWYIHGNWKLDSTQLATLEKDVLKIGTKQEKEKLITTFHTKDEKLSCLDFLYSFYKDRVDEIAKDQFFFYSSVIHFSFWLQIYDKTSQHPIHDHFGCGDNVVVSFVHFLKPVDKNCFRFTDGREIEIPQQEEGDLIVFPPYVSHQVVSHTSNENRVILAGNIDIQKRVFDAY